MLCFIWFSYCHVGTLGYVALDTVYREWHTLSSNIRPLRLDASKRFNVPEVRRSRSTTLLNAVCLLRTCSAVRNLSANEKAF